MKFFAAIDERVLSLCTGIAHFFQELTGRTNYFIAKIGVVTTTLGALLEIVNYFHKFLWRETPLLLAVMSFFVTFLLFFDAVGLEKADRSLQSSEEKVLPDIVQRTHISKRLFWLAASVFSTLMLLVLLSTKAKLNVLDIAQAVLFSYGMTIFYYFVAVEPLKPGKSSLRQWAEKFSFGWLKTVPAPND